jgi:hypothetical protein
VLAGRQVVDQILVGADAGGDRLVHPSQVVQQHAGVGRALLPVTRGGPRDQRVDVVRDAVGLARGRWHVLVDVLVGHLDRGLALVGLLAGQQLVEDHAHGVDVGAGVGAALDHQLGCDVGDGPDQDAGGGVLCGGTDGLGQPEVGDLDPAVVGDQHVLRLDVAVDQPGPVGRGQRGHDGLEQRQRPCGGEWRLLADGVAHGVAGDQLHGQEDGAVVVPLVVDPDHVGVGEPRGRPSLAHEPGRELVVVAQPGVHHLDGHGAVQAQVGRLVDGGHATARDPRGDPVAVVEDPTAQVVAAGVCCGVARRRCGTLGGMPVRRHGDLLHPAGEGSGGSMVRTRPDFRHFDAPVRRLDPPGARPRCGWVRRGASMGS